MFGDKISIEVKGLIIAGCSILVVLGLAIPLSSAVRREVNQRSSQSQLSVDSSSGTSEGALYTKAQLIQGNSLFKTNCVSCHGADASGGAGPSLRGLRLSDRQIDTTIANGRRDMPAFGKQFSAQDIVEVVAYLRTLK